MVAFSVITERTIAKNLCGHDHRLAVYFVPANMVFW